MFIIFLILSNFSINSVKEVTIVSDNSVNTLRSAIQENNNNNNKEVPIKYLDLAYLLAVGYLVACVVGIYYIPELLSDQLKDQLNEELYYYIAKPFLSSLPSLVFGCIGLRIFYHFITDLFNLEEKPKPETSPKDNTTIASEKQETLVTNNVQKLSDNDGSIKNTTSDSKEEGSSSNKTTTDSKKEETLLTNNNVQQLSDNDVSSKNTTSDSEEESSNDISASKNYNDDYAKEIERARCSAESIRNLTAQMIESGLIVEIISKMRKLQEEAKRAKKQMKKEQNKRKQEEERRLKEEQSILSEEEQKKLHEDAQKQKARLQKIEEERKLKEEKKKFNDAKKNLYNLQEQLQNTIKNIFIDLTISNPITFSKNAFIAELICNLLKEINIHNIDNEIENLKNTDSTSENAIEIDQITEKLKDIIKRIKEIQNNKPLPVNEKYQKFDEYRKRINLNKSVTFSSFIEFIENFKNFSKKS